MKKLPIFLIWLFLFIFPPGIFAAFSGGINIGDHYSEFDQAVNAVGSTGWIYVMMRPENEPTVLLKNWLTRYPNINFIVRGHYPDIPLDATYAQKWADSLNNLPRPIYFVPVNEPNNPQESNGGIPAEQVVLYTLNLIQAFNNQKSQQHPNGLLADGTIKLLSPAIDVYTLFDSGPSYINALGGWDFFSQFKDGIALNLYGEYIYVSPPEAYVINDAAPPIKRGQGYREFLQSHFGATSEQAQNAKIFAVETGVKKVGEIVKYRENAAEIVDYFNRMNPIWGSDSNFVMHAIFSYDPISNANPPWIYTETAVLAAMGLTGGTPPAVATPTPTPPGFQKEYEITKNANERLLPKTILKAKEEKETSCKEAQHGIQIGTVCIPFLNIPTYFGGSSDPLVQETEYFQPYFVTQEKKESLGSCGLIFDPSNWGCYSERLRGLVPKQVEVKETGNLNAFRPQNLEFSQINNQTAYGGNNLSQNNSDKQVLAATVAPLTSEERVKKTYEFTQRMLRPRSIGNLVAQAPTTTLAPGVPTPTLLPGVTPTPTSITPTPTGAHYGTCREGSNYCSVDYLLHYFPNRSIAQQASVICNKESGSNPFAANKGCLTGRFLDYSIGLFQINLLAHCPGAFSSYTRNPITCTIADRDKLKVCETRLYNPDENIREAVRISSNGTNWAPWSAARVCGIVP